MPIKCSCHCNVAKTKVASQRAKDPQKKKDLGAAHREYQSYINKNKKSKD